MLNTTQNNMNIVIIIIDSRTQGIRRQPISYVLFVLKHQMGPKLPIQGGFFYWYNLIFMMVNKNEE